MAFVRNPKDFWTGIIYMAIGGGAVILARGYGMGTAVRMGPGYFPTFLGGALTLIGVTSLIRSFVGHGEPVGSFTLRGLALVLGATLATGLLIRGAGLAVAIPALVLISAWASKEFRWGTALALAAGLTVFCALVFAKGLGIPLKIVGPWLGG